MTIQEMHIGIELGLQRLNSNVFGKLQREEKDYYINTTTQELVKLALSEEENTVFDIVTYQDIRKYYEKLQKYIRSIQLGLVNEYGKGYVYGALPSSIAPTLVSGNTITSGVLYHGAKYKVLVAGTTDLSGFGYKATPVVGETFECNITEQTGGSITIVSGETYRIVNAHGATLTTYGAANNNPGTEFLATSGGAAGGGASTKIQPLTDTPSWASTTLALVGDVGYFMNISSYSSITKGSPISSGALTLGKKYIVKTVGSTDLSSFGGVATPDVNYVFTCTTAGTPSWTGGTILYEIDDTGNRLVKFQDVNDFLENSFGTVKTSPISVLANDRLRVYHDNKFDIERIHLDYIVKPIPVDYNNEVDSDLPDSVQPFLIDLVVKRIMAFSGNPAYNAVVNETQNKD